MVEGTNNRQIIINKLNGKSCSEVGGIIMKKDSVSVSEAKRVS